MLKQLLLFCLTLVVLVALTNAREKLADKENAAHRGAETETKLEEELEGELGKASEGKDGALRRSSKRCAWPWPWPPRPRPRPDDLAPEARPELWRKISFNTDDKEAAFRQSCVKGKCHPHKRRPHTLPPVWWPRPGDDAWGWSDREPRFRDPDLDPYYSGATAARCFGPYPDEENYPLDLNKRFCPPVWFKRF